MSPPTRTRLSCLAVAAAALALPVRSPAEGPAEQPQFGLSLVGGMLLPGSISVSPGGEPDTTAGFIVRGAGDYMITPRFSVGAYSHFASASLDGLDRTVTSFALGATVKAHFQAGNVRLRPGAAIGYQLSDVSLGDSANGFGAQALFEVGVPVSPTLNFLGHVSFLTQPAGGNSSADVTWAPIFYLAVGVEYAR